MRVSKILCDECGKEWPDKSPPSDEAYESGLIEIQNGMMLLPPRVRPQRDGPLGHDTTPKAASLEGIYCDYRCLFRRIKRLLKLDELDLSLPPERQSEPPGRKIIVKAQPDTEAP